MQKKPDRKENTLQSFLYLKLKNKQNSVYLGEDNSETRDGKYSKF